MIMYAYFELLPVSTQHNPNPVIAGRCRAAYILIEARQLLAPYFLLVVTKMQQCWNAGMLLNPASERAARWFPGFLDDAATPTVNPSSPTDL